MILSSGINAEYGSDKTKNMGVPFFYRWLTQRYPHVLLKCIEVGEEETSPNVYTDNLYLDFNSILHMFFHPHDTPQPRSLTEVMNHVCGYMDRIVNLIRPRNILFISIDGVAPKSKLNNQRGRRFRNSREKKFEYFLSHDSKNMGHVELEKKIVFDSEGISESEILEDSNFITPGTCFMEFARNWIRRHVENRLLSHPHWKILKVIFSDSLTPGEGEHKIMDFIRSQKLEPGYNSRLRHVLYGNDADLIMLGLGLHEAHVMLLRELDPNKHVSSAIPTTEKKTTKSDQNLPKKKKKKKKSTLR
eukprot:TRINITY_DN5770_c0_g2_i4.p1 TRINITY_DN5770_c0_g2~~TRINITY_DN5770_c0_g2_i4.p1  ORF type:complete len:303 (-),score=65.84 TRINITY_DN5770_c0_g2_i4:36-944(-)